MRWFLFSCRFLLALLVFSGIIVGICLVWMSDTIILDKNNALDTIINHDDRDNTVIYARDQQIIAEVFSEYRVYVPYEEMPQLLIDAVLAIEDRKFFVHHGFDLKAIARAFLHNLKARAIQQGASTITQQVIKNYSLSKKKKFHRKIKEILLAIELERILPKEKILNIYLNNLFLGNRSYGVGAAAKRYFSKHVNQLDLAEIAMIAGLFRAPSKHDPTRFFARAKVRQHQVLSAMVATGKITTHQYQQAYDQELTIHRHTDHRSATAPYFVDHVIKQAATLLQTTNIKDRGLRIYTTLDLASQKQANKLTNDKIFSQPEMKHLEMALLSIDPKKGEILTMVGGRNYQRSKFNRTVQALRPPGSSFKPLVYSYALTKGMSWNDVNFVAPISIDSYRPREHHGELIKETTLYRSFYKSLNLPVIELGKKFGIKSIIDHAYSFGIKTKLKEEMGTVLGGSDIYMTELANIYAVFANRGKLIKPIAIKKITDRHGKVIYRAPTPVQRQQPVISEQISYLLTAAMQDVFRRGTASRHHGFYRWAAGKTGTSDEAKDNWFCGYSNDRVTIVWLGSDDFSQKNARKIYGATVALPIWAKFMNSVTKQRHGFAIPPGIVASQVNPRYGHLDKNGIRMYFRRKNQPTRKHSAYEALSKNPNFRAFKWN